MNKIIFQWLCPVMFLAVCVSGCSSFRSLTTFRSERFESSGQDVPMNGGVMTVFHKREIYDAVLKRDYALIGQSDVTNEEINFRDDIGRTPLMLACILSDNRSAIMLISRNANVNEEDTYKRTALMFAAEHLDAQMIRILLKAGASARTKNSHGKTAGNIARNALRSMSVKDPRRENAKHVIDLLDARSFGTNRVISEGD